MQSRGDISVAVNLALQMLRKMGASGWTVRMPVCTSVLYCTFSSTNTNAAEFGNTSWYCINLVINTISADRILNFRLHFTHYEHVAFRLFKVAFNSFVLFQSDQYCEFSNYCTYVL